MHITFHSQSRESRIRISCTYNIENANLNHTFHTQVFLTEIARFTCKFLANHTFHIVPFFFRHGILSGKLETFQFNVLDKVFNVSKALDTHCTWKLKTYEVTITDILLRLDIKTDEQTNKQTKERRVQCTRGL